MRVQNGASISLVRQDDARDAGEQGGGEEDGLCHPLAQRQPDHRPEDAGGRLHGGGEPPVAGADLSRPRAH